MLKFILLCAMLLASGSIHACDICGSFMGITPYNNYSSFGIFYRYRAYNGYAIAKQRHDLFPTTVFKVSHAGEPHGEPEKETELFPKENYELYRILEARGKYFIHKRIELNTIIPIYFNSSKTEDGLDRVKGLGDISVFAGYHLISKIKDDKIKHRLILGAGVKLSTGEYQMKTSDGHRHDALLQPGTGSNDMMTYFNYLYRLGNFGFTTNLLFKINGKNSLHERISNSINNSSSLFYMLKKGKLLIVPSLQIYYENTKGLRSNHDYVKGTQLNEMMVGPGLDLFLSNFSLNYSIQFTTVERTDKASLGGAGRMVLGISYNILQERHLIGKRPGDAKID